MLMVLMQPIGCLLDGGYQCIRYRVPIRDRGENSTPFIPHLGNRVRHLGHNTFQQLCLFTPLFPVALGNLFEQLGNGMLVASHQLFDLLAHSIKEGGQTQFTQTDYRPIHTHGDPIQQFGPFIGIEFCQSGAGRHASKATRNLIQ